MPRAAGQIDVRKSEAILQAATEVLAARGLGASIEEVARRAGVSKQTIYNHFGSKTELIRTLMDRRRGRVTAPLEESVGERSLEDVLAAYALIILQTVMSPESIQLMRMGVAGATDMPEVAAAIYDAGPRAALLRLARFLEENSGTEIVVADPLRAAEMFSGMVLGRLQTRLLFGLPADIDPHRLSEAAHDAARRFLKAFRP